MPARKILFGLCFLVSLSGRAIAATPESISLFAMTLGKAPALRVCAPPELADSCLNLNVEETARYKSTGATWYDAPFDGGVAPDYAASNHYLVAVHAGRVEQILLVTKGLSVQQEALKELNDKFGFPKEGAAFDKVGGRPRITIRWDIGDQRLVYVGAEDHDPGTGFISAAIRTAVLKQPKAPHL